MFVELLPRAFDTVDEARIISSADDRMIKRRDYLFSPNIYWPVKQTLNKSSLDFSAVTNDQRGLHKIADLFSDSLIETRFDHFATLAGSLRKAVSTLLYFAVARKIRQSQHPSALMGWTLPSLIRHQSAKVEKQSSRPGESHPQALRNRT